MTKKDPRTIPQIQLIEVESVFVSPRLRSVSTEATDVVAKSLASIGLRTPITVRSASGTQGDDSAPAPRLSLVAGATRLAAAKKLGWTKIEAIVVENVEDDDARLWEIAENLHRAELTVQERADHIAEWIRLTEQKISAQLAPKSHRGRPEGGINAASRSLRLDRRQVQRSLKIANITDEAKAAARDRSIDNNQSALLEVAQAPKETQASTVHRIADAKSTVRCPTNPERSKDKVSECLKEQSTAPSSDSSNESLKARAEAMHRAIFDLSEGTVTAQEFWSIYSTGSRERDRIVGAARQARERLTSIAMESYR